MRGWIKVGGGGVLVGIALACGGGGLGDPAEGDSLSVGGEVHGELTPRSETHPTRGAAMVAHPLEVARDGLVQIDLTSQDFDAYLYVLDRPGGRVLHENDDRSAGSTDARVAAPLEAGTYQVIATAFGEDDLGGYTLRAAGVEIEARGALSVGEEVQDTLTRSAPVGPWRTGAYHAYTLTVSSPQAVTLDMTSEALDAYLLLFDEDFVLLEENDDATFETTDAQISTALDPGTYWVIATTFGESDFGDYTLRAAD